MCVDFLICLTLGRIVLHFEIVLFVYFTNTYLHISVKRVFVQ